MKTNHRFPCGTLRSYWPAAIGAAIGLSVLFTMGASAPAPTSNPSKGTKPTVVLVHGAWADGSSWSGVTDRLQRDGYTVIAPANPLRSLTSDSAYLASILATITGPIVLVGHSYGGMVTTNAALGNPNVKALVYVAAFIPDVNENALELATKFPGSLIVPPGVPGATLVARGFPPFGPPDADLYISPDHFRQIYAADLPAAKTTRMASTQRPIALDAFQELSGAPAWKTIPSWAMVATDDEAIGTPNSRFMAHRAAPTHTVEIGASHAVLVSHPDAVEDLIRTADSATR
jgi:pimeloyl-ACP methyl ester carboxylesterase